MWIILGLITIIATFINLLMYAIGKDYKLAMAMGLSFTALTLCAEYSLLANFVKAEDWGALLDVVPIMEKALWILIIISILLNITPILLDYKRKKIYSLNEFNGCGKWHIVNSLSVYLQYLTKHRLYNSIQIWFPNESFETV